MQAVRAQYQANHHLGRMRPSVLRTLRESADGQLDNPHEALHDFESLESKLTMSPNLQKLARTFTEVPVVEEILKHWIYLHLAFSIELACEFVRAHQAVGIKDLLGEGPVADKLIAENNLQLSKVHDVLNSQLPVFPEITHALKTQTAARQLLMFHMREIDVLVEEGSITEKEYESMLHKTDEMLIKLHSHPLAERLPQMADMLVSSNFLRGVAMEDVEKLAGNAHMFTEMFVEPGVKLFKKGETAVVGGPAANRHGWFLLVRGLVRMSGEESESQELLGGGDAENVFSLRPARSGDVHGNGLADVIVRPGATFGLFEQVLGCPFAYDFDTISYCHVLYVDAAAILKEAAKPTPCGESIFLGLFKAMALPLVPGLLRFDNNRRDPLRLVTSRDRYNGWESTGFMVHASATEAEAKTRRETCSAARKNDYRFLGLKALDKAVFHRPTMEELAHHSSVISHIPSIGTSNNHGTARNVNVPSNNGRERSLTASESTYDMRALGNFSDLGEGVGRKRALSAVRWTGSNLSSNFDKSKPDPDYALEKNPSMTESETGLDEAPPPPPTMGKRPSFFIQRSTFAMSHPPSLTEKHGMLDGENGETPMKSQDGHKSKKASETVQWVIEVSASKAYLLVRGKILGRASHSKETAGAMSMIEGVKNLAQRAGDHEHISEAELMVLHTLLHKLQKAPLSHHSNQASIRSSSPRASPRHGMSSPSHATNKALPHSPLSPHQAQYEHKMKALAALDKMNDDDSSDDDSSDAVPVIEPLDLPPIMVAASMPSLDTSKQPSSNGGPPPMLATTNLVRSDSDTNGRDSFGSPVNHFIRMASEMNLNDLDESTTQQRNADDAVVPEMVAPYILPKSLKGRLQVTARTVIMEVPSEFKAASAALKMLSKLRYRQRKGEVESFMDTNSEDTNSEDEESKSGDLVSDLVLEMLTTMRANRGTSPGDENKSDDDDTETQNSLSGSSSIPPMKSKLHSVGFVGIDSSPTPPAPKLRKKKSSSNKDDPFDIFN